MRTIKQQAVTQRDLVPVAQRLREDRERARALAQARNESTRAGFARTLTAAVIDAYWSATIASGNALPELPIGVTLPRIDATARKLAVEIGAAAAQLDLHDAGYLIGTVYTVTLPDEYRSERGVYYTPPVLTSRLLDLATEAGVDWTNARVLDPACGGGAFMAPAARRILAATPGCDLDAISSRIRGYELDPFSAWMSQVLLEVALANLWVGTGRRLPWAVEIRDSLELDERNLDAFDLVIGNPPYGRVRLDQARRALYARSLYGHANLYGLFTDLALRLVKASGVVAYVTPTSFLGGDYYRNLRDLLGREAAPVALDFVEARRGVFADVLQEAALTTFRRDGQRRQVRTGIIETREDGGEELTRLGTFGLPKQPSAPWILPRTSQHCRLVDHLAGMPARLETFGFQVSTGPLVWNRHKPQLKGKRVDGAVPIVWAEAISPQGSFRYQALKRNHAAWFVPGGDHDEWLLIRAACILLQRTTAKEQARRLIAAEMPQSFVDSHGAVTIENHVNMVRPSNGKTLVSPATIAALLNSAIVDQAFRCLSGSVAVSAAEVNAIPLPSPDELGEIEQLVRRRTTPERIDAAISRLYVGDAG